MGQTVDLLWIYQIEGSRRKSIRSLVPAIRISLICFTPFTTWEYTSVWSNFFSPVSALPTVHHFSGSDLHQAKLRLIAMNEQFVLAIIELRRSDVGTLKRNRITLGSSP